MTAQIGIFIAPRAAELEGLTLPRPDHADRQASAVTAARIQNDVCIVATKLAGSAPTGSWPRLRETRGADDQHGAHHPERDRAVALRAEAMPVRSGGTAFMTMV